MQIAWKLPKDKKERKRFFLDLGFGMPLITIGLVILLGLIALIFPETNSIFSTVFYFIGGSLFLISFIAAIIAFPICWIYMMWTEFLLSRYGWLVFTFFFGIIGAPLFYLGYDVYEGYRGYLKGKEKLEGIWR